VRIFKSIKCSEEKQYLFKKAGRYEGRKNRELRNRLKNEYNYPQIARDFMEEYGGLRVENTINSRPYIIDFRLEIPELDLAYVMDYNDCKTGFFAAQFGFKLYYLGELIPDNYFVCCDDKGRIYKFSDYCFFNGSTPARGIENILAVKNEDSIIFDNVEKSWFKRSDDSLSFTPVNFEDWVAEH